VGLRNSRFCLLRSQKVREKKSKKIIIKKPDGVWPLKYGAAAQKRRSNSEIIIEVDSSFMFDKASKRPRDRYEVTVWGKIVKTSLGAQNLHSAPSRRGTCSPGKSLCKELWIQKENFQKGRRDSRVSPAESIVFAAAKPWILSNVDLHCMPVSAAGLMRIFTKFHIGTIAAQRDVRHSAVALNSFWNVEPLDARRTHAYYGISTTPIPRFSSKSKRQMQNAKVLIPSLDSVPNLPDLSIITRPQIQGSTPLRILLFLYEQKIKIKNAHAIPRNMAISKSRSESSLSTQWDDMGAFSSMQARCRRVLFLEIQSFIFLPLSSRRAAD
jgi:hypothetical protein